MLERPFFVMGCPRSGTTLLQLMLHAHPRLAVPPETRFLLPAYSSRLRFGDLRREDSRRELARWIVARKATRFYDLGLDADATIERIATGPPTLGSGLHAVYQGYAARFDKPRWGEKRPAYIRYIGVLRRLFPDAQFVHLVRDGRDCVASLLEMSWWPHGVRHAVATWAQAIDHGRRAARSLPAGTYHELRYESLVSDPEPELRALCAFLGEEYDPAMAEPSRVAAQAVPRRKRWHARTRQELTAARFGSWRERLSPADIALCESALGRRLTAYGYELSGAPAPSAAELLRYSEVAARRRLAEHKWRTADLLRRVREPNPVARVGDDYPRGVP